MSKILRSNAGRYYTRGKENTVLADGFLGTINLRVFKGSVYAYIHICVLLGGHTGNEDFVFVSLRRAIGRAVAVKHGSTIPTTFPHFLGTAFRYLSTGIFTLSLDCHEGGKGRRLTYVLKKVGTVFRTSRISPRVLRSLRNERRVNNVTTRPERFRRRGMKGTVFS